MCRRNSMRRVQRDVSEARRLIAKHIEDSFIPELTPKEEFDKLLKKLDRGD
jgi:hypothetical protein